MNPIDRNPLKVTHNMSSRKNKNLIESEEDPSESENRSQSNLDFPVKNEVILRVLELIKRVFNELGDCQYT